MPELPNYSSVQKIRTLCQELAVKHGLDEATRDELSGHLEDKLSGYLSGEVKITEEDALQLVRAHFGDANRVARQIARHPMAAKFRSPIERLRRTTAVTTAVFTPAYIASSVFPSIWQGWSGTFGHSAWRPAHLAFLGIIAMFELEIRVAAIVDRKQPVQRLIAALMLIAAISILLAIMISLDQPSDDYEVVAAGMLARAFGTVALIGHAFLLFLVLLPLGFNCSEHQISTAAS